MYQAISSGEQQSARLLIEGALQRSWTVSVFDGEAWAVKNATTPDAIIDALGNTDQDNVVFRDADGKKVGEAVLVWGNSAPELVSDSSMDDGGAFDTFLEWHEQAVTAQRLQ